MKKLIVVVVLGLALWGYSRWAAPDHAAWQAAQKADTLSALRGYVDAFPRGFHVTEAQSRLEAVRNDASVFDNAVRDGTRQAYERFLQEYPGHVREGAIRSALEAGDVGPRDLIALVEQGKVELAAQGSGIEHVHIRIRRLTSYPLIAAVPPGVLFVPNDPADQTMMSTDSPTLPLADSDWHEMDLAVACTNWTKDVPSKDDRMRVRRSSNANLNAVAPLLANTQNVAVRQALVWIMSDNVNYHGLGKLVSGCFISFGCEGTRVIGPAEAAEAVQILMSGGIDVRRWAIWRDRAQIYSRLEPGPLKDWLRAEMNR